jgi:hypothetical protein
MPLVIRHVSGIEGGDAAGQSRLDRAAHFIGENLDLTVLDTVECEARDDSRVRLLDVKPVSSRAAAATDAGSVISKATGVTPLSVIVSGLRAAP